MTEPVSEQKPTMAKKPHPYSVNVWEVEKYEGEWAVFAKGYTNPLVSTPVREAADLVCARHNEGIGYLRAVVAAWRELHACMFQPGKHYGACKRLVELNQIETPREGCYLKLKEAIDAD